MGDFVALASGAMYLSIGTAVLVCAVRFGRDLGRVLGQRELLMIEERRRQAEAIRENECQRQHAADEGAKDRELRERELVEYRRDNELRAQELDRGY